MSSGRVHRAFELLARFQAGQLSPLDMTDGLWLAQVLTDNVVGAQKKAPDPDPTKKPGHAPLPSRDRPKNTAQSFLDGETPDQGEKSAPVHELPTEPTAGEPMRATRVGIPMPHAIGNRASFERALRPFLRRYASGRHKTLDADATATLSAERQFITPVFHPVAERWFDVVLLLEQSAPMAVWKHTARELRELFARHGAFRNVWLWTVAFSGDEVVLTTELGLPVKPRALIGENGRRIVLMLTHGHGEIWTKPMIARWIDEIGKTSVLAFVQLLPERAWPFSDLGGASDWVASSQRALMNRQLATSRLFDEGADHGGASSRPAIPMFPLRPDALAHWADFVMSARKTSHPAVTLTEHDEAVVRSQDTSHRIERFRRSSSPAAFKLLRLLSACPVSLPVMKLIQQAADIDPSPSVLAEVLLSGLLLRPAGIPDTETTIYDFDDEGRTFLFEGLSSAEARLAEERLAPERERIRKFVEEVTGKTYDNFRALLLDKEGIDLLPAEARAFVSVSRRLYEARGVLNRETATVQSSQRAQRKRAAKPLAVTLFFESDNVKALLEVSLTQALDDRGHGVVTKLADMFVWIGTGQSDQRHNVDLCLGAEMPINDMAMAIEDHVVMGRLRGWAPIPSNSVGRKSDLKQLRERLMHLGATKRPSTDLPIIAARPDSGAKLLLQVACDCDEIRQLFQAGIFFNLDPDDVPYARRGPALVFLDGLDLPPSKQKQRAIVRLTYTHTPDRNALYDIDYVGAQDVLNYLTQLNASSYAVESGAAFHRRIPILIPISRLLYANGVAKLPKMTSSVEDRLMWGIGELAKHMPTGEPFSHLVRFAVKRPGCPNTVGVNAPPMAISLAWAIEEEGRSWMVPQVRSVIRALHSHAFAEESNRFAKQLIKTRSSSQQIDDYCASNLIVHAYEAGGISKVAQFFSNLNLAQPDAMRINELHKQCSELELVAGKDAAAFRKIRRLLINKDLQTISSFFHEITDWNTPDEPLLPMLQRILIITNAKRYSAELEHAKSALLEIDCQPVIATLAVRGRRKNVGFPNCQAMLMILAQDEGAILDPVMEHAMYMLALARQYELPVVALVEYTSISRFGAALESMFQSLAQTIPILTYWSERDLDRVVRDALKRLRKVLRDRPSRSSLFPPVRRPTTLPAYPTPPLPAPISNPMDLQSGRWGKRATRLGRRLVAHLIKVDQNQFTFDIAVHSVDRTDLQGPVIFHLHDTYPRKTIYIRKIREEGTMAVLEKITAYGVYTVGVQVMVAKGQWTSLELDLRTLVEQGLPRRFLHR